MIIVVVGGDGRGQRPGLRGVGINSGIRLASDAESSHESRSLPGPGPAPSVARWPQATLKTLPITTSDVTVPGEEGGGGCVMCMKIFYALSDSRPGPGIGWL